MPILLSFPWFNIPMQRFVRLLCGRFSDFTVYSGQTIALYYFITAVSQVAAPRQVPGLAAVDYGHWSPSLPVF